MKKINIALVGNATGEDASMLNTMLSTEGMPSLYTVALYGADGQPENEALADAVEDCIDTESDINAIVCLPMAQNPRKAIRQALGENSASLLPVMINEEERYITSGKNDISDKAEMLMKCLKRDLRIDMPRMAVVGNDDLKETVDAMFEKGIQAFGPYSNEILKQEELRAFDGIIIVGNENADGAEQKILEELHDSYITLMAGAEMAIASAQPKNLYEALAIVADITRNRVEYDLPLANPLPKLYVEKKEDGDKARYIKKKGFDPAAHKRENVTYTTAPRVTEPAKESSTQTEKPATTEKAATTENTATTEKAEKTESTEQK